MLTRGNTVLVKEEPAATDLGYSAIIGAEPAVGTFAPPSISGLSSQELQEFKDGDVVLVEPNGSIIVLWEASLPNNAFLLTTACNCRCLMCPQPPEPHSSQHMEVAQRILALISPDYSGEICLTGENQPFGRAIHPVYCQVCPKGTKCLYRSFDQRQALC